MKPSATVRVLAGIIVVTLLSISISLAMKISHRQKEQQALNQVPKLRVNSLPEYNVFIVDRSVSSFEEMFSSLVSVPNDVTEAVKQFSVFVANKSDRAITACAVKWEFLRSDGKVVFSFKAYSHFKSFSVNPTASSLNIVEAVAPAVKPHSSRLISLFNEVAVDEYPARLIGDRVGLPADKSLIVKRNMTESARELSKRLEESASWSVTLDGVFFADGTFVGPDSTGYFDRVKARFDAKQDLLEEVARIINQAGVDQVRAYAEAFKYLEETVGSEKPKLAGFKAGDFYKRSKAQLARVILTRRQKLGDQQAVDFVENELGKPFIQLVKR